MGRNGIAQVIVVDTSALVAMVFNEPERGAFEAAIHRAGKALVSLPCALEAQLVVHGRRGQAATLLLQEFLRLPVFELVSPSKAEIDQAYAGFVLYGKGSGHPANLNFGDLFSYALAKTRGLPLLFKGDDFAYTDLKQVIGL
jgi:ribonuclease VapC